MKISYLDEVLCKLIEVCENNDVYVQPEEVHKLLDTKETLHKTYSALDKIYIDGYAYKAYLKENNKELLHSPTYYVNFEGLYFSETNSYVKEKYKLKLKRCSKIAVFLIQVFGVICLMITTYLSVDAYLSNQKNLYPVSEESSRHTEKKELPMDNQTDTTMKYYRQSLSPDTTKE